MAGLVYYSSTSGNTARFVARSGLPALRIPISPRDRMPGPDRPYVLVCPTYADGDARSTLPKQVIRFLNDPGHRAGPRGVIAAGNRNFGATFALPSRAISDKYTVPVLYRFELAGNDLDISRVPAGLRQFWEAECLTV